MFHRDTDNGWMRGEIASSLPGRLRLTVPGLQLLYSRRLEIAQRLAEIAGVRRVRVTIPCGSVLVEYHPFQDAIDMLDQINMVLAQFAMDASRVRHEQSGENVAETAMTSVQIGRRLAVNAASALIGNIFFPGPLLGIRRFTAPQALASLYLSLPMIKSAAEGIRKEKRPNADFLTVTSIAASLLLGSANSALTILALSDIAELMTSYTIEKTRSSIREMLSVDDSQAWRLNAEGRPERVPVSQLQPEDTVVAHTGEKICADGQVVSGTAVVDQSAINGEFIPAEKHEGDEVYAGTVVKSGNLHILARRVGDQTVVSRIVGMVETSALKRAPIQRYADRFSNWLVPLNFLLCAAVYAVTKDPQKALKMLVIDYSCGIRLSTATAFSAAIHTGVRQGILIKGGAFIEQMAGANTVLFDKTGTVTEGKPQITGMAVLDEEAREEDVLRAAMAAEETSTHPLARCILEYGMRRGIRTPAHGEVVTEVARGTRTEMDGHIVRVGSWTYMQESGAAPALPLPPEEGAIASYVAVDKRIIGVLWALDRPRENVRRAINSLRHEGVADIELLTGDTASQAALVAGQIGVDGYSAHLLPEEKAEAVLRLQTRGNSVIMVGDGINDAPALAYADVGISLGSKSTDIAMETSDIVIGRDDPMMIPDLRQLAAETMRIVNQNFALVIAINTVGLILGAASNISVLASAAMHNLSTILVVANSMRLLFRPRKDT